MNPGRFVIDTNKFAKEITIKKIKLDMKVKEYAAYTVIDSAVQYYLRKVFDVYPYQFCPRQVYYPTNATTP